jgi:hypothetical protein
MADFLKMKLADVVVDRETMEVTFLRDRGEGKFERVRRALNTSDFIAYLLDETRTEIAELRGRLEQLEGKPRAAKPAKKAAA